MTHDKKKLSIDDESPDAWTRISKKHKYQAQWHDDDDKDDAPNEHPVFGEQNMVDNPPHYNNAGIETIDAIEAMTDKGFEYYLQGNIMKYLWRYRYKNGAEDLKKAQWYLNKLIKNREDYEKSLG